MMRLRGTQRALSRVGRAGCGKGAPRGGGAGRTLGSDGEGEHQRHHARTEPSRRREAHVGRAPRRLRGRRVRLPGTRGERRANSGRHFLLRFGRTEGACCPASRHHAREFGAESGFGRPAAPGAVRLGRTCSRVAHTRKSCTLAIPRFAGCVRQAEWGDTGRMRSHAALQCVVAPHTAWACWRDRTFAASTATSWPQSACKVSSTGCCA